MDKKSPIQFPFANTCPQSALLLDICQENIILFQKNVHFVLIFIRRRKDTLSDDTNV